MTTIQRVDDIPIEGYFTFESYDGFRYKGQLEKKDVILRWLIQTHKQVRGYPTHVYESLDEIFISPVLFLPDDLITEVTTFVETPRLPEFCRSIKPKKLLDKDLIRCNLMSIDEPSIQFLETGRLGDIESFRELYDMYAGEGQYRLNNYLKHFIDGMIRGKHYSQLYKFFVNERRFFNTQTHAYLTSSGRHFDAWNLIYSNGQIHHDELFEDQRFWDAFLDFNLPDDAIISLILNVINYNFRSARYIVDYLEQYIWLIEN